MQWNLPLGVRRESPGGSPLLRRGGTLVRARLCSQDTFVPGERGRSGTWKEGGCARRDFRACGVGSGELDGGCGEWRARRPPGGHRELRDPPRAGAPFLSDPSPGRAASLLTQMCGDQSRRGGGRWPAPTPLRSPSAGCTKAVPEAPARPLPRRRGRPTAPRVTVEGGPHCQPPALAAPSGAACSAGRRGVPRLTHARQPGR